MPLPEVRPVIIVMRPGEMLTLRRSGRPLSSEPGPTIEEDFLVLVHDIERYEDVEIATGNARLMRPYLAGGSVTVGAVGSRGEDLSGCSGAFEGIVQRAPLDTFEAWFKTLEPLLVAIKFPDYEETLPAEQTQGGVTPEEFEENFRASQGRDP